MVRAVRALALLFLFAAGCSPLYAYRSAAGEAGLLWHRRSIERTIADPVTPPGRRERFKLVLAARRFAVERLALSPSRDYSTWTPVDGAVTWLVYACSTTSLKPITFLGFPYKGHFRREWAEREAAAWTKKGYDAAVFAAAAFNTPLPISDPLPSSVLDDSTGSMVELLIHEFAHGTLGNEESAPQWIGAHGAALFLRERFGEASPEFKEWTSDRDASEMRAARFDLLGRKLEVCYAAGACDRAALFAASGIAGTLNNAVVAAHKVYRGDPAKLDTLFEASGRDWPRFIAALKKTHH